MRTRMNDTQKMHFARLVFFVIVPLLLFVMYLVFGYLFTVSFAAMWACGWGIGYSLGMLQGGVLGKILGTLGLAAIAYALVSSLDMLMHAEKWIPLTEGVALPVLATVFAVCTLRSISNYRGIIAANQ